MERVLVVDDDPQVLSLIKQQLQTNGFEVLTSGNFRDARALIEAHKPGFIVADVRLGDFNGIQLGMVAKSLRPDVHIVIMSGWDDGVLRREAGDLGAVYLQKPFDAAELVSALTRPSTD